MWLFCVANEGLGNRNPQQVAERSNLQFGQICATRRNLLLYCNNFERGMGKKFLVSLFCVEKIFYEMVWKIEWAIFGLIYLLSGISNIAGLSLQKTKYRGRNKKFGQTVIFSAYR